MDTIKIIEVKKSIFEDNDAEADRLRARLKDEGTFLVNLMSSPGAGKTSTLLRLAEALKDQYSMAVMEADIDSDVDARRIRDAGIPSIQIHTGGMCHLDAAMTEQGYDSLDGHYDLVVLENVGNLVCPAEFDTGATTNCMILSVPEGDDKPLKYPLMFSICDLVLINKLDTMPVFDFDLARCEENVRMRNPNAAIIPISAKTGEGIEEFAAWVRARLRNCSKIST